MPHFLTDEAFDRLLADLNGVFMAAATTTGADLNDKLIEALACADLLPESCRPDFMDDVAVQRAARANTSPRYGMF